jgi:hypothetical protein
MIYPPIGPPIGQDELRSGLGRGGGAAVLRHRGPHSIVSRAPPM